MNRHVLFQRMLEVREQAISVFVLADMVCASVEEGGLPSGEVCKGLAQAEEAARRFLGHAGGLRRVLSPGSTVH